MWLKTGPQRENQVARGCVEKVNGSAILEPAPARGLRVFEKAVVRVMPDFPYLCGGYRDRQESYYD